jgi:predicted GNAT family N-acyltransferase
MNTTIEPILPSGFELLEFPTHDQMSDQLLEKIAQLRYAVWQDQGMSMENIEDKNKWNDDFDEQGYFLVIKSEGQMAGSARMSLHETIRTLSDSKLYLGHEGAFAPPIASLNRLIIHPDFRMKGLSRFILQKQIQVAQDLGAKSIALDCPVERVGYHQKMGFQTVGKPVQGQVFSEVMFQVMCLEL